MNIFDDSITDSVFGLLNGENPLINGLIGDKIVNVYIFGLSDSVSAIFGLKMNGFVPP